MSVGFVIQHGKRMRRVILSSMTSPAVPHFSTLSHKRRVKVIEHKMCVSIFSTNVV